MVKRTGQATRMPRRERSLAANTAPQPSPCHLFDLAGGVAIVTGGAGLLGAEFCHTLAQAGARVIVADIDGTAAASLANAITQQGGQAIPAEVDVTDVGSIRQMVSTALHAFGGLDILVNSAALDPKFDPKHQAAGGQHPGCGAFEDFPLEAWNQALAVNLTGVFLCCQAAVQPMLERGGGVIVNLSSIYGLAAPDQRLYQRPGQPPQYKPVYYPVTKAGILGLTRYLAAYYAGKNIRVNALSPGGVYNQHDETFVQAYSARAVMGRMAEKDEMNGALLFLVSQASAYMTGANLVVDGGWTAW
ncbi:MAG: SDR family oxidoreductase [Anaerolineales bacterium]|nr:SDR family oxidoreductase [Anaerolineales bacterium]